MGAINHLEYNRRSNKDYQIHHLLPLPSTASSDGYLFAPPLPSSSSARLPPLPPRHALYGRNNNAIDDATWRERAEERAIERRAYIYREKLFAKHIASNIYTKFKPFTPQSFSVNSDLKARVIKFVRREVSGSFLKGIIILLTSLKSLFYQLQVFPSVDVVFLTTYVISIASQLDLRSASAIRLLSDFLNEDDAEHFSHEVCTFARSSFSSLEAFDRNVQYPRPERPDEAILNAVNGGRIDNSNGQKSDGKFNKLPPKPTRNVDQGLLNDNNRYASIRYDQSRKDGGRRGSGGQTNQEDYFRASHRGGRNDGRFSRIDRYAPERGGNDRNFRRSRSRSRSRSRNDGRASNYSSSRDKDRSKMYSNYYSNSPSRSRSRSRSRNSRSRSFSPAPRPRSRSQTPTHDDRLPSPVQPLTETALASISNNIQTTADGKHEPDALSFTLAPESDLDFELTPLDRSPHFDGPTVTSITPIGSSISIFGAAKRRSGSSIGLLQSIQKPLSQKSSSTSLGLLGRLGPVATSSVISSADDNASQSAFQSASQELLNSTYSNESENIVTELPISDLKTKLQDRLMAEYRTALANKGPTSACKLSGDALRLVLHERLRSEKSQSDSALRERVIVSRKRHLEDRELHSHRQEDEEEEEEGLQPTAITWNADTRALLLARLEEEKSRTNGIAADSDEYIPVDTGNIIEVARTGKEESLRLALSQRRKSSGADKAAKVVAEVLMKDRADELRRKLKQRRVSAV